MSYIIFFIHSVAIVLLARMLLGSFKIWGIHVTIHNLPYVILCGMGLGLATWFAVTNLLWFILIGILFGGLIFVLNSVEIPNHPNPSFMQKILIALFCTFFLV